MVPKINATKSRRRLVLLLLLIGLQPLIACTPHRSHTQLVQTANEQSDVKALAEEGTELLRAGERDRAEQILRKALRLQDSVVLRNNLGVVMYQRRQYASAAAEFAQALRLSPDRVATLNNLGLAWEAQGRFPTAAHAYRRALQIEPENLDALRSLARVRIRSGAKPHQVRDLLEELVAHEVDGRWLTWAQGQLQVFKPIDPRLGPQPAATQRLDPVGPKQ